ncbi:hypothetical protein [Salipiger sp. PrR003]|uniref:hypothetical protein n=1 Tax=Salipiger sp. PrR003 TaxID=2706776 RepID=UPI0013D9441A|nr:hypothetical protein [Salipiger sp. PrR003]NDV50384.1 hypothetical protein [Salipiger sp. PrR003]
MATAKIIPELIVLLLEHEIPVSLHLNKEGDVVFHVDGFGKCGRLTLSLDPEGDEETMIATDRYKAEEGVASLTDMVYLNMRWAEITAERMNRKTSDFGEFMTSEWKKLAVTCGLAKEENRTVTTFGRT